MLKKIFFPLLMILCCINNIASAQVTPDGILFQAVARDANGNAAAGRNIYANPKLIPGGGAFEMEVSARLTEKSKTVEGLLQFPYLAGK